MKKWIALFLVLAGCFRGPSYPTTPPETAPKSPPPKPEEAPTPKPKPTTPEEPKAPPAKEFPYTKAWDSKKIDWIGSVAIAPWGDVVSASSAGVYVLARDTGELVKNFKACSPASANALGFRDAQRGVLVCDEAIVELYFPEGSWREIIPLREEAAVAFVGATALAVLDEKNTIEVYSLKDLSLLDAFALPEKSESLLLSPDDKSLLVSISGGKVLLRDLATKTSKTLNLKSKSMEVELFAVSPKGDTLFAKSETFEAALFSLSTGEVGATFEMGSWIKAARFLSPTQLVAVGSDGVVLYESGVKEPEPLLKTSRSGEAVGLSQDGSLFCSGDRQGIISCFSSKELAPSQYSSLAASPMTLGVAPYLLAWSSRTGEQAESLEVAPWGDLVARTREEVQVLARDTGKLQQKIKVCRSPSKGSMGFRDEKTAVLVCDNKIIALSFVDNKTKDLLTLKGRVSRTMIRAGLLVVVDEKGAVTVYSLKDLGVVDRFEAPEGADSFALSSDGKKLVIGAGSTQLWVREIPKKTSTTITAEQKLTPQALSEDGRLLFAEAGGFESVVYDLSTNTQIAAFRAPIWMKDARFVSSEQLLVAGADGLFLYKVGRRFPAKLTEKGAEAISLAWAQTSKSDLFLCAAFPAAVTCFSSMPLAPSVYASRFPSAGSPPDEAAASPESSGTILEGTISARKGKLVTVTLSGTTLPAVGTTAILSKRFERMLGKMTVTGWMEVAEVKVKKVEKDNAQLEITEEKSEVIVNGKKVDHFLVGNQIKLAW